MAQKLSVREIGFHERDVRLRLPFRFGASTLEAAPQAFLRVRVRLDDDREGWGAAAEMMIPKWFDKDPGLSNEDNFDQLRRATQLYADLIGSAGENTAFGHSASLYETHLGACSNAGLPALVAAFGPALIDRAVLDALSRLENVSFAHAIRSNLPAIDTSLTPDLEGFDLDRFLMALEPTSEIAVRHTVGLVDCLESADLAQQDRLDDGLPETLEEICDRYRHRYFKLKVNGDIDADIERLAAIAEILDACPWAYKVTLDGNEQYDDLDAVDTLLASLASDPRLAKLNASILYIEQPVRRAHALERDVRQLKTNLPLIIDESDAQIGSFVDARALGYQGVLSKACKGFYKSILNAARCQAWRAEDGIDYFMSGEDLTCQSGLSVQQDLALVSLLGLAHVERNGHHFVAGMAGAPEAEQRRFVDAHSDLYEWREGFARMKISDGKVEIGSLQAPGFGSAVDLDWSARRSVFSNKGEQ